MTSKNTNLSLKGKIVLCFVMAVIVVGMAACAYQFYEFTLMALDQRAINKHVLETSLHIRRA